MTGISGTYDGFSPNTPHDVTVKANNDWGNSPSSSALTRYTLAETPEITFGEVTTGSMILQIANHGNAADTAYRLERSTDGESFAPMEDYTVSAGASDAYYYMVTGLYDGTLYYFRVKARNGDGIETAYAATASRMTLPVAPTGLAVTPQEITEDESGNQSVSMLISWTAPTGAESYSIYRKAAGEAAYTRIEAAYQDGTLYMDTGLTPNVRYTYTIVAKNASGESESSGEVSAYTLAAMPEISSAVAGNTINLAIHPNGNPEFGSAENAGGTEYFIQYSTDDGETWTNLSDDWYNYLTPQHTGVSSGDTYQYRGQGEKRRRRRDGLQRLR